MFLFFSLYLPSAARHPRSSAPPSFTAAQCRADARVKLRVVLSLCPCLSRSLP